MTACGVFKSRRGPRVGRMIGKDYFKRQATTLRKMVGVAQDKTVADRLTHLAADFEAKADGGSDPSEQPARESGGRESGSGRN